MDSMEVLIERPFDDPTERLGAMQCFEDMVNFLRAEKAKWVLVYCDTFPKRTPFGEHSKKSIAWKFQIQDEDIRRRFDLIFDSP